MHSSRIDFGDSSALSRPALLRLPIGDAAMRRSPLLRGLSDAPRGPVPGFRTLDEMATFDAVTRDAAASFLISELERLDPRVYLPLYGSTWQRDIDIRQDVTVADEISSFVTMSAASPGGIVPNGIAWASKTANTITGVATDYGKTSNPLHVWAMECKWTVLELASSQRVNKPIDQAQFDIMQMKYNMDIDRMVYVGDTAVNAYGMLNHPLVTNLQSASTTGTNGATTFASKTADQMLDDLNVLLTSVWAASGYNIAPQEVRLPPLQFGKLASKIVSSAGNSSIIAYLANNNLVSQQTRVPLNIQPLRWLAGAGSGGLDRMIAYTRDESRLRYPMTLMQRMPLENRSLYQIITYYARLGVVEVVYPETIGYMDGI